VSNIFFSSVYFHSAVGPKKKNGRERKEKRRSEEGFCCCYLELVSASTGAQTPNDTAEQSYALARRPTTTTEILKTFILFGSHSLSGPRR